RSGSMATSAPVTKRWAPDATSVMMTAARRAARSALSILRMLRRIGIPLHLTEFVGAAERNVPTPTLSSMWHERSTAWAGAKSAPLPSFLHFLHIDPDGAAARQADLPGGVVGNAEFQHLGLAAVDDVNGFGDHRAFDATARHRAEKIPIPIDDKVGTD